MPIYEYKCQQCEHVFEMIQPFNAMPPESCPACESGPVEKLISQTSFILKGGGWYKDGYSGPSNGVSSSSSNGTSDSNGSKSNGSDSSSSTSSSSSSASSGGASAASSA